MDALQEKGSVRPADLRQKPPFLYVDRVAEDPVCGHTLHGVVCFDGSAHRFTEPSRIAGVLVLEALAQLSGILLRRKIGRSRGGVLYALDRVELSKDRSIPAEILLSTRITDIGDPISLFEAVATHGGAECCRARLAIYSGEV